jgi:hypothetical protein
MSVSDTKIKELAGKIGTLEHEDGQLLILREQYAARVKSRNALAVEVERLRAEVTGGDVVPPVTLSVPDDWKGEG